jgi:hypothetical protein
MVLKFYQRDHPSIPPRGRILRSITYQRKAILTLTGQDRTGLIFYPLQEVSPRGRILRLITYQRKRYSNTYMTALKFYPLHKIPYRTGLEAYHLPKKKIF